MGFFQESFSDSTIWTVSEITGYIKELFEIDFRLQDIEVEGEISNFTHARSGHLYFTLKDDKAQIKCVMWRSSAQRMPFDPQEGDSVLVHGRISVYEPSGVYQLYADRIEPAGRGDLALAFERLKEQLAAEGLFDQAHKKAISSFPKKIGIVTSADAAALRDILNIFQRRCPIVRVLIAPSLVQGDRAPQELIRALHWLDGRDDIDTIIIARGGGSIEDLWAFNDENLARAIYAARHPIISGVGHETDFTIADFVADLRAPTPSAAAELAVPDLTNLPFYLVEVRSKNAKQMSNMIQHKHWLLQTQSHKLALHSPLGALNKNRQWIDNIGFRLEKVINQNMQAGRARLAVAAARLSATSPLATLSRGYAIVRKENGQVVRRKNQISGREKLTIQVSDGDFGATADELTTGEGEQLTNS